MRTALWVVRLQRDNVKNVREHVVAIDADHAMKAATAEHQGYIVTGVERISRVGNSGVDTILVGAMQ